LLSKYSDKKTHIIVLLAAILFAAGSTFFMLRHNRQPAAPELTYHCYNSAQGWGYDILHGKKIIIHQPFIPGLPGTTGFNREDQAREAARIVIENIKSGGMPSLTHQQLQQLGVLPAQSK
jgi:hypothetical protein